MESPLEAPGFAEELVAGWASMRSDYGHGVDHGILALGGRHIGSQLFTTRSRRLGGRRC
jgi:hypothetical protein